jgi:L(+)-tartrate dehydratase alpha subunit
MDKEQSTNQMTDIMARFVSLVGKKLPDDVWAKLNELRNCQ